MDYFHPHLLLHPREIMRHVHSGGIKGVGGEVQTGAEAVESRLIWVSLQKHMGQG